VLDLSGAAIQNCEPIQPIRRECEDCEVIARLATNVSKSAAGDHGMAIKTHGPSLYQTVNRYGAFGITLNSLSAMFHRLRETRHLPRDRRVFVGSPEGDTVTRTKVLLVDDDEVVRFTLEKVLEQHGFDVTTAANVPEALKHISSNPYDVLLSDLHMPGAGDGLTVVSAMRHANPKAVTMLLSAFPEMDAAAHAILMQTDQILLKPMEVTALVEAIKQRLINGAPLPRVVETVAAILERSTEITIRAWFDRIKTDKKGDGNHDDTKIAPVIFLKSFVIWCLGLTLQNQSAAKSYTQKPHQNMESTGVGRVIPQRCWWKSPGCCRSASLIRCKAT
jgi:CheY-like chemotaxis protein